MRLLEISELKWWHGRPSRKMKTGRACRVQMLGTAGPGLVRILWVFTMTGRSSSHPSIQVAVSCTVLAGKMTKCPSNLTGAEGNTWHARAVSNISHGSPPSSGSSRWSPNLRPKHLWPPGSHCLWRLMGAKMLPQLTSSKGHLAPYDPDLVDLVGLGSLGDRMPVRFCGWPKWGPTCQPGPVVTNHPTRRMALARVMTRWASDVLNPKTEVGDRWPDWAGRFSTSSRPLSDAGIYPWYSGLAVSLCWPWCRVSGLVDWLQSFGSGPHLRLQPFGGRGRWIWLNYTLRCGKPSNQSSHLWGYFKNATSSPGQGCNMV